jgi:hypothetical protein
MTRRLKLVLAAGLAAVLAGSMAGSAVAVTPAVQAPVLPAASVQAGAAVPVAGSFDPSMDAMLPPGSFPDASPVPGVGTAGIYPQLTGPNARSWTRDTTDTTPSHYYVWCDQHVRNNAFPRDRNGIIMVNYSFRPSGPVYNPVTIASDGLNSYETYLHVTEAGGNTPLSREAVADFLNAARWLRDKGMDSAGRFVYTWDCPRSDFRSSSVLRAPWYSAMAQGLGISVLTRAYSQTGDTSYLKAARLAFHPFEHDIKDGGVTSVGRRWFEEYPDGNHVLNGSVFAMFGVYDLWRATGEQTYKDALDLATDTLATNLYRYESHGSVLYELVAEHFSQPTYFILQNSQLDSLSVLTGDKRLSDASTRWKESFRAYPAPEFHMTTSRGVQPGSRLTLSGTLWYFFRAYYPASSRILIRAKPAGSTRGATLVASLPILPRDDTRATFSWVTPPITRSTVYEFSVLGQPTRAPWLYYTQRTLQPVELTVSRPTITPVRIAGNPASPNGDRWNDSIVAVYGLGGSPSLVNLKVYDAGWRLLANIPGKMSGGKQAVQWNGTNYTGYGLRTSSGATIGDGMYYYIVEARNSMGSAVRSGTFFVCRDLVPKPTLAAACSLTSVGPTPGTFAPGSGESTAFRFTNADWAWVTIKVFGTKGLVRTLCANTAYAAGANERLWDGKDNAGRRVPAGLYRYMVFASSGGPGPHTVLLTGAVGIR